MARSTFILLSLLGTVYAANDWSKPCLAGVCYYDLPSTSNTPASGSLKIWGSADAISDITTAAGWEIIECQKDALSQDVRLVCTGGDAKCAHLYKTLGAEGKVVRLPESCGSNAFARVAKAWVPENQAIPANVAKRLVRRNGVQPEVKALRLDTNFGAVNTKKTGPVNFALTGSNVQGAQDLVPFPSSKTAAKQKRQFFRNIFNSAKDAVTGAADAIGNGFNNAVDAVSGAAGTVVDVVQDAADTAGDFVNDAVNAAQGLNEVSVDESVTLDRVNVNRSFNLLNRNLQCGAVGGSLKIDVDAKANIIPTIGVAAQGTIAPPRITDFALTGAITGEIDGVLKLAAGISGQISSGQIQLLEVGIPGLSFPGILTIGPSFTVSAEAIANLDLTAKVDVGLNYQFSNAQFVFPPNSARAQQQGGAFLVSDTPLKLSVTPSAKATGRVEAHLIPALNLGISALGGVAEAQVFVNLDASAAMQLELEATAQAAVTINRAQAQQPRALAIRGAGPMGGDYFNKRQLAATPSTSAGFGGCFTVLTGLDVNVGADANFFGLFNAGTKVPLFTRDFELFKRCFGNRATRRRSLGRLAYIAARSPVNQLEKRVLACPAQGAAAAGAGEEGLVDETVPASRIRLV